MKLQSKKNNRTFQRARQATNKRETAKFEVTKAVLSEGISTISAQLKPLRQTLKLCQEIEERSTMLSEQLTEIRKAEQESSSNASREEGTFWE